MLTIALLSTLSGGEGCVDMETFGRAKEPFLRRFMRLEHGIPSHDTLSRLFRAVDPEGLREAMIRLARGWAERMPDGVVAIDGKELRRSFEDAASRSPLHLLQAFAAEGKLVLGQVAVDGKSNETPALLELLDVQGRLVTADALHAQRSTAGAILDKGGDYVLAPRPTRRACARTWSCIWIWTIRPPARKSLRIKPLRRATGASRRTRRASATTWIGWPNGTAGRGWRPSAEWRRGAGWATAGRRSGSGTTSCRAAFGGTRRRLSAEEFGRTVRSHWSIENSLHRVLDVTLNEDRQRNRKGNGPENLAALRRTAPDFARTHPAKGSMRGRIKKAGWDDGFLIGLVRAALRTA